MSFIYHSEYIHDVSLFLSPNTNVYIYIQIQIMTRTKNTRLNHSRFTFSS